MMMMMMMTCWNHTKYPMKIWKPCSPFVQDVRNHIRNINFKISKNQITILTTYWFFNSSDIWLLPQPTFPPTKRQEADLRADVFPESLGRNSSRSAGHLRGMGSSIGQYPNPQLLFCQKMGTQKLLFPQSRPFRSNGTGFGKRVFFGCWLLVSYAAEASSWR